MSWHSQPYLNYIGPEARERFFREHTPLGYHPETGDILFANNVDRFSGAYLTGIQGSGKSGLLQNMITHDINTGQAVIVLDPHGDLVMNCLHAIPDYRRKDTYLIDSRSCGRTC